MENVGNHLLTLQDARKKVRFSKDILSMLDIEEWISLIFLVLDADTLVERGYNYCQYVSCDRLQIVAATLEKNLLHGACSSTGLEESFDPVIKALYVIGRYDILVDHLGFCLEHNLHEVCKNLQALDPSRLALYLSFSDLTQEQTDRLVRTRLHDWHSPDESPPLEITFCRNLNSCNYKTLISDIHEALLLEGYPHSALRLHPFLQATKSLVQQQLSVGSETYPLPQSEPHGVCVIINIKQFMPPRGRDDDIALEVRRGSDIDSDRLEGTFKLFGFAIVHLINPDYDELHQFFTNLRRDRRLYDVACLAVCVMTHGDENDNLYLYDRSCIAVTDLRKLCYTQPMIGKPRLYFVQACRGDQNLRPVLLQRDSTTTSNSESDCLISAATVRGYSAMRSQSSGSWFITDLCSSLQEMGHVQPLKSVLKETRKKLMRRVDRFGGGYVTQISEDKDTLTMEVQLARGASDTFLDGIVDLTMLEVLEEEIDALISLFVEY